MWVIPHNYRVNDWMKFKYNTWHFTLEAFKCCCQGICCACLICMRSIIGKRNSRSVCVCVCSTCECWTEWLTIDRQMRNYCSRDKVHNILWVCDRVYGMYGMWCECVLLTSADICAPCGQSRIQFVTIYNILTCVQGDHDASSYVDRLRPVDAAARVCGDAQ